MRFYTTIILSANQELTPEGFLVCRDVPIARTGTQLYGAGETPIAPLDGLVRIERTPEEVFHPRTIASFEGKSVTLDHPTEDVNPANWSRLAKGTVVNVRRGTAVDTDLLLADLLITDADAIAQVRAGLREVSCGYDAEYKGIEAGRGMQTNIVGNHVALVEKGRCGSRCAIGDSMKKKLTFIDRLRAAFKNRDEAELEKVLEDTPVQDEAEETEEEKKAREAKEAATADAEGEGEESEEEKKKRAAAAAKTDDSFSRIMTALDAIGTRLDKLEGTRDGRKAGDADEEEETEEQKKKREDEEAEDKASDKARDSAAVVEETQDVLARAEILSPGLTLPTFDAAMTPAKVRDSLCQLRLRAVTAAFVASTRTARPSSARTPTRFRASRSTSARRPRACTCGPWSCPIRSRNSKARSASAARSTSKSSPPSN